MIRLTSLMPLASVTLAAVLLTTAARVDASNSSPTTQSADGPQGDVNCDLVVDGNDALTLLRRVAGLPVACMDVTYGDVNCDAIVNPVDALSVLRWIAGLPSTHPDVCPRIGIPLAARLPVVFTRGGDLWKVDPWTGAEALLATDINEYYAGWLGKGSTAPVVSARGTIAFTRQDRNVWLVEPDGRGLTQLSHEARPEKDGFCFTSALITGWSPGGSRIAYYIAAGEPGPDQCEAPDVGVHVVDLETGARRHIADESLEVVDWLDEHQLILQEDEGVSNSTWYTLDTDSLTKEHLLSFDCYVAQPSFSSDREVMTYNCSQNYGSARLVVATSENTEQTVVVSGDWAEYQFPLLSPGAAQVAYVHEVPIGDGLYRDDLYSYDLESGSARFLTAGQFVVRMWLDDHRLIIVRAEGPGNLVEFPADVELVDVTTGEITVLATDVDYY